MPECGVKRLNTMATVSDDEAIVKDSLFTMTSCDGAEAGVGVSDRGVPTFSRGALNPCDGGCKQF